VNTTQQLPSELQRAAHLLNKLRSGLHLAKRFDQPSVRLDIADCEELAELLADSLRTAKQYELFEFDHSVPLPQKLPQKKIGDRSDRSNGPVALLPGGKS
jgi:hypothetical protein